MLYRKTPPIQFIPAFDAAVRHLSFKKAARELCVTAPAVGQKVRAFEDWLGTPLFHRHTRLLSLTAEGEYYAKIAQDIMKIHSQGYIEYERRFNTSALHVSAPLYVAQELMMPNYLQFSEYSPGTELRIEARMSHVDFDAEAIDAAIRFGDGDWPELNCRQLCKASVSPVCSETYANEHEFTQLNELYKHRLIYASPAMDAWGKLFWDEDTVETHDRIICDSYLAALKAASDGLGVTLAIFPTANTWVNSNRIMLPFPVQININMGYWMVTPKRMNQKPEVEALYDWMTKLFAELPSLDNPITTVEMSSSLR